MAFPVGGKSPLLLVDLVCPLIHVMCRRLAYFIRAWFARADTAQYVLFNCNHIVGSWLDLHIEYSNCQPDSKSSLRAECLVRNS